MNYSDLPTAEVDRSQFIGDSHQLLRSFFGLTFSLWAGVLPRPKSFSGNMYLISLLFAVLKSFVEGNFPHKLFAYGIDGEKRGLEGFPQRAILNPEGQDIQYFTRKYWGFVIHLKESF